MKFFSKSNCTTKSCDDGEQKKCKIKCFLGCFSKMIVASLFSLIVLALFINYAPPSVSRFVLNPYKFSDIVRYAEAQRYKDEMEKTDKAFNKMMKENPDILFKNANDPVIGKADAKVTIVEFSDYKCSHCHKASDELHKVMADPKYANVRLVLKPYPVIGGPESIYAAGVSIAFFKANPEKFHLLNEKLFAAKSLTANDVDKIVSSLGVNHKSLDVSDESVAGKAIVVNYELGQKLFIQGTPAFVIGTKIYRGYIPESTVRSLLDAELSAQK